MTRQESTDLLRAARRGSPDALGEVYARYGGRLLAFIRMRMGRTLRARVESRDILQSALLKSFQHLDQFEGEDGASLMRWLVRIAENEIRDQADFQHRLRRNIAVTDPLDGAAGDVPVSLRSALSTVLMNERYEQLGAALEGLDSDYREVIVLRKIEERSFREVAARMGRSEDACRMLLARAMVALTLALGADA